MAITDLVRSMTLKKKKRMNSAHTNKNQENIGKKSKLLLTILKLDSTFRYFRSKSSDKCKIL